MLARCGEEVPDGRRARERDRVDLAVADRVDQADRSRVVLWLTVAVHGHVDQSGTAGCDRPDRAIVALAVVLEGDDPTARLLGDQQRHHLVETLAGRGRPDLHPGDLDRRRSLGPPGDHARAGERAGEPLGQAPRLGRLEPCPHADPGGGHEIVRRSGDHHLCRLSERVVTSEVLGADGGRVQHVCAPTFEQLGLLGPAPVGGDADDEALQRKERHATESCGSTLRDRFPTVTRARTRGAEPFRYRAVS